MKTQIFFSIVAVVFNLILSSTLGCSEASQRQQVMNTQAPAVIYGKDNRQDVSEVTDQTLKGVAHSTVALISKELLTYDSAFKVYRFEKPASSLPLCPSERFREQSTWAHCSGSLIAPDLVLTAGHCVIDLQDCQSARYVFDYELTGKEQVFSVVSANSVYNCAEVVYTTARKNAADFALVRLDRKVEDRAPLKLARRAVGLEDQLMMIGHPEGYPTKFTFNGKVRDLSNEQFMKISIDAYTGNSGSSVFDQTTHEIVGVLSRGETDYVRQNSCLVSNVCDEDGCRGEDVTRIEEVEKFLATFISLNASISN